MPLDAIVCVLVWIRFYFMAFMAYEYTVLLLFQLYTEARRIVDRSGLVVYVCASLAQSWCFTWKKLSLSLSFSLILWWAGACHTEWTCLISCIPEHWVSSFFFLLMHNAQTEPCQPFLSAISPRPVPLFCLLPQSYGFISWGFRV